MSGWLDTRIDLLILKLTNVRLTDTSLNDYFKKQKINLIFNHLLVRKQDKNLINALYYCVIPLKSNWRCPTLIGQ